MAALGSDRHVGFIRPTLGNYRRIKRMASVIWFFFCSHANKHAQHV